MAIATAIAITTTLTLAVGLAHALERPRVTQAPTPQAALWIGNSLTAYHNGLAPSLARLVPATLKRDPAGFDFGMRAVSDTHLIDHAKAARLLIAAPDRHWDAVVLQGYSNEPIHARKSARFAATVRELDRAIRAKGAQTVLFMTWAYEDRPEMTAALADAYTRLGNELGAFVVPVGLAFAEARSARPDLSLYEPDRKHPSLAGTYLNLCTFFAALYGQSPAGAPNVLGLAEDDAQFLQQVAWETVRRYYGWH